MYSGGEDAYPFNEIARPAPRGHLAKTKRSTGWLLMQILAAAATEPGRRCRPTPGSTGW